MTLSSGLVLEGGGLLTNELGESLRGTLTVVLDGGVLLASREEVEGGEALDIDGVVVLGGITLGDDDGLLASEELAELLPLGGKSLAVAAPGGVELNEDILGVVHDDLLVLLGDDNLDGAVVLSGDLSGLDGGGELALEELLDVLGEGLGGHSLVLGEDVVLTSGAVLDDDTGGGTRETEGLGVLAPTVAVELGEDDLVAELLGDREEGIDDALLVSLVVVDEDPNEGDVALDVLHEVLGADLTDEGEGLGLDEGSDISSLDLTGEGNLGLVEGAVEGDLTVGLAGEDSDVSILAERDSSLLDLSSLSGVLSSVDDNLEVRALLGLELGELLLGLEDDEGGLALLGDPLGDSISLTSIIVLGDSAILGDELQSGETTDTVSGAEVAVLSAVNLSNDGLALEVLSSLLVLGSKSLRKEKEKVDYDKKCSFT